MVASGDWAIIIEPFSVLVMMLSAVLSLILAAMWVMVSFLE